jgi:hypothetical protein
MFNCESATGSERSKMAWALATAGKNSVRNIASGKASSMKRLVVNLCRKHIMCFIRSTCMYYLKLLCESVKAHLTNEM